MGQEVTNPKLTVDFSKTPFWQALDQTLDQAKLTVYPYAGKDELGIMARRAGGVSARAIGPAMPGRCGSKRRNCSPSAISPPPEPDR